MSTPDSDPRPQFVRIGRPAHVVTLRAESTTSDDRPVSTGKWVRVSRPAAVVTLVGEPVLPLTAVELTLPLIHGTDGTKTLGTLNTLIEKLNEMEGLLERPGVRVDDLQSGIRNGKVVIVLAPNDPNDAVETCKRIADQLFAAIRTLAGVTVRVFSAEHPDKPVYELAV